MLKHCLVLLLCAAISAPALAGGYGGYRYGFHKHHHGGGDSAELLAGLVIGGLVGYFIGEDRGYRRHGYTTHRYRYETPYHGYRRGHPYHGYSRRTRVYYHEPVRVAPPPRVVVRERVIREPPTIAGHACRMTREYTTTVEIDGRRRDAYGTKCLTADGSWVLGAPKLVPNFD